MIKLTKKDRLFIERVINKFKSARLYDVKRKNNKKIFTFLVTNKCNFAKLEFYAVDRMIEIYDENEIDNLIIDTITEKKLKLLNNK